MQKRKQIMRVASSLQNPRFSSCIFVGTIAIWFTLPLILKATLQFKKVLSYFFQEMIIDIMNFYLKCKIAGYNQGSNSWVTYFLTILLLEK